MDSDLNSSIASSEAPADGVGELDTFVSYARADLELEVGGIHPIERLLNDLDAAGKRIWLDRSSIEPAAEWRARVALGIEAAKSMVFVLTPRSVASAECARELEAALAQHKRIIPIVLVEVPEADVPPPLRELNWIYAREGDDYKSAFAELLEALEGDLEWRDAHARLAIRTREWTEANRDSAYLLRGSDLRAAEDWYADKLDHKEQPTDDQYRFIIASRRAASRRQRVVLGSVVVALGVAVVLAIVAFIQRSDAISARNSARAAAAAAGSEASLPSNFTVSAFDSLDAYRADPTVATRNAVVTALEQPTTAILRGSHGTVNAVAFSADGSIVASGGEDGTLHLWNVAARREVGKPIDLIGSIPGHNTGNTISSGQVTAVAFSAHGGLLAAGSEVAKYTPGGVAPAHETGRLTVWSIAAGTPHRLAALTDPNRSIEKLAFSPDGTRLAIANDDGTVDLLNLSNHTGVALPAPASGPPAETGLSFTSNGQTLAFVAGSSIEFWDVAAGQLTGIKLPVSTNVIAFDPRNANVLAVATGDAVALYNVSTGQQLASYTVSLTAGVSTMAFSPDGGAIALGIGDVTQPVLLYVGAGFSLGPAMPLNGSLNTVESIAFNPQGTQIVTGADDATVRVLAVPGLSGLARPLQDTPRWTMAVGGTTVAAFNLSAAGVGLWDLAGRPYRQLAITRPAAIAISPDARLIAVDDGSHAQLLEAQDGHPTGRPMALEAGATAPLAFSPDGRLLVGDGGSGVRVFDVGTQVQEGSAFPVAAGSASFGGRNAASTAAFNGDGSLLAVGDGTGQVRIWNVGSHTLVRRPLSVGDAPVRNVAFDPAADLLGVVTTGQVQLWNLRTGKRAKLDGDSAGDTGGLAFSPDGSSLAAIAGCRLDVWDPATSQRIGPAIDLHYAVSLARGPDAFCDLNAQLAFASDGSLVVNLDDGGPIYVWSPLLSTTSYAPFQRRLCAEVGQRPCPR